MVMVRVRVIVKIWVKVNETSEPTPWVSNLVIVP